MRLRQSSCIMISREFDVNELQPWLFVHVHLSLLMLRAVASQRWSAYSPAPCWTTAVAWLAPRCMVVMPSSFGKGKPLPPPAHGGDSIFSAASMVQCDSLSLLMTCCPLIVARFLLILCPRSLQPSCHQVFKHHHEESTGRTSSIGQHTLCLDSAGAILNDSLFRCVRVVLSAVGLPKSMYLSDGSYLGWHSTRCVWTALAPFSTTRS